MNKIEINNEIKKCYPTEDSEILAKRLGLSVNNLRRKAARMKIKKIRPTITNEIIDGMKLCPNCSKVKLLDKFNKDKYQPNNYDYWCRECRLKAKDKDIKTVQKDSLTTSKVSQSGSMAFGIKKTYNPIIMINDNPYLKCKGDFCNNSIKPLSEFYADSGNNNGVKNICKYCMKKKRAENI